MSLTTAYREPIATAALCDLCNFEPAVLVCCITDPLISTVKTRLCADCEPTHSRAVVRLLSRERQLVVSWAGAVWVLTVSGGQFFAGYNWGALALVACWPLGFWLLRRLRPLKFLARLVRRG